MKGLLRLFVLFWISSVPVVASEDDGDWEFLRSRLTDSDKHVGIWWQKEIDTFRFFPNALKFIAEADSVEVYEGLPHQTFEAEALKKELGSNETIRIGGYPFYSQPQALDPAAKVKLMRLMEGAAGFSPFTGHKMCGGFHPDYVIRFKKAKVCCDVLICFGCGDAKINFQEKPITCSIQGGWHEFLGPYAKKRPAKQNAKLEPKE